MSANVVSPWITIGGAIVEVLAAFIIAFHACLAIASILRYRDADRPRLLIAEGVLAALGFSVAGTLLKALALQSWRQIGTFAFIFALRTTLKQVFKREREQIEGRALTSE